MNATDQASELRLMMAGRETALPPRTYRSLAVASGKGGVGKTNIAVNLGLALAQSGIRVALVDADWGLSNTEVLLGIKPRRDLRDVLNGLCDMEEIVSEAPHGLKLIPGASGASELANLSSAERERLLHGIARIGNRSDLLLFDTAPGISDSTLDLALNTDLILLVTTPEPTSLADAYAFAKSVFQRRKDAPVGLVVNQAESRHQAEEVARGISTVTQRFLGQPIPLKGFICTDARVSEAVRRQTPFLLSDPHSIASSGVKALAETIMKGFAFRR